MITRDEAILLLSELSQNEILDDEICEQLNEIANCIEDEKDGLHGWGADDDYSELHVSHRADLITDAMKEKSAAIYRKYAFTPSLFEVADIGGDNE